VKVSIRGKEYDIGKPGNASAKMLEILMNDTGVPLEAMAAVELAREGLNRCHRDLMMGSGMSLEAAQTQIDEGWRAAQEVDQTLYNTVRD